MGLEARGRDHHLGTFKLTDVAKRPGQWEFAVSGGGVGYAIYQIDAEGFKYCAAGSPEARPAGFTTAAGDGRYCCVWKRAGK